MNQIPSDSDGTIATGHVLDALKGLSPRCVQTTVTSPPYYAVRSYGTAPQIWGGAQSCDHRWKPARKNHRGGPPGESEARRGRDKTPQAEARAAGNGDFCERCTAWRGELGQEPTPDQYVAHLAAVFGEVARVTRDDGTLWLNIGDTYHVTGPRKKELIGIPWLTVEALRSVGWLLRQEIIWHKTNPMPLPVRDRCLTAHESIFLFSKSPREI